MTFVTFSHNTQRSYLRRKAELIISLAVAVDVDANKMCANIPGKLDSTLVRLLWKKSSKTLIASIRR